MWPSDKVPAISILKKGAIDGINPNLFFDGRDDDDLVDAKKGVGTTGEL